MVVVPRHSRGGRRRDGAGEFVLCGLGDVPVEVGVEGEGDGVAGFDREGLVGEELEDGLPVTLLGLAARTARLDERRGVVVEDLGRKRVMKRLFNVGVPRARVPETTSTLRDSSER